MKILSYYNDKCLNQEWYDKYFRCGKGNDGSIFKILGTNYRDLSEFESYFNKFKKYEGKPRNTWEKKKTTGQEIAKQYVVNMVDSFLFISKRNNQHELIYELSSRGRDFENMLNNEFSNEEKKLLTIIYLINSAFQKTPRYLLKQSYYVLEQLNKGDYNEELLIGDTISFLLNEQNNKSVANIFDYDIVWNLSFYSDIEFLKLYNISSNEEKRELKDKTKEDYKNANNQNVLSQKYKSTNFQRPTLIDTIIIIYLAKVIKDCQMKGSSFREFYEELIYAYSKIIKINNEKVLNYLFENENIFKVIYKNAISEEDDFTEMAVATYRPKNKNEKEIKDLLKEKIDSTSQEGLEKLEIVRSVLKKLAKEKSQYKCALHDLNQCKYFTSKEEHKNYLEIHHLVPREFSYSFEDTIEFVENYVPLCPHCHRMIHKAEDRERITLINQLYAQRKIQLENNNIKITIKDLYDFYKIDKDNQ